MQLTEETLTELYMRAQSQNRQHWVENARTILAAHNAGAQGEIPSCDVERMRAAFESARPAVKKFHYQWDTRRQCYLLDGDEDRGQYMQNEFADWCEAWCAAIASQPLPQTDAARDVLAERERCIKACESVRDRSCAPEHSWAIDDCIAEIERLDRAKEPK